MELKVDLPALAGRDIDPETFQRVWNRVMPDQAPPVSRESPALPDTAVPAQPSPAPSQAPEEGQDTLPPVPGCPAQPEQPPVPVCPACPECAACPACPSCPEAPACPECPAVPGTPQAPALCLGEASRGDSQQLEALMTLARSGAQAARALSRRASGACARALSAIAQDHRMAFRRLSAAYFLITGTRCAVPCEAPALPANLPLALRQQFVWEQQWEQKNNQAARNTADPCLKELYLELVQEGALHAGTIRSLLEQMA